MTTIDSVLIRCVSRLDAAEEEPTLGWATPTLGKVPRYLLPSNFHVVQDLPPSKARIFYAGTCRISTYTNLGTVPYLRYCPLPDQSVSVLLLGKV